LPTSFARGGRFLARNPPGVSALPVWTNFWRLRLIHAELARRGGGLFSGLGTTLDGEDYCSDGAIPRSRPLPVPRSPPACLLRWRVLVWFAGGFWFGWNSCRSLRIVSLDSYLPAPSSVHGSRQSAGRRPTSPAGCLLCSIPNRDGGPASALPSQDGRLTCARHWM
jgi:hypothetical protein